MSSRVTSLNAKPIENDFWNVIYLAFYIPIGANKVRSLKPFKIVLQAPYLRSYEDKTSSDYQEFKNKILQIVSKCDRPFPI